MGLCRKTIVFVLWMIVWGLFALFQKIVWVLTGTNRTARRNKTLKIYKNTAHVLKVICRYKMDLLAQPSGLDNFLCVHNSFQDPEYVLARNVTLYSINNNEAIFVETDADVDVRMSECNPFLRVAQFKNAKKVILLPLYAFQTLALNVPPPEQSKLVFVTMTSRCGSTLLTQIFEERGDAISLSEPDAMAMLLQFIDDKDNSNLTPSYLSKLITSTVHILCKKPPDNTNTFLMKLPPQATPIMPHLCKVFPRAKQLFMYRNGYKMCRSLARAIEEMPMVQLLMLTGRHFPDLTRFVGRRKKLPTYDEHMSTMVQSPWHFACICWSLNIKQYIDFWTAGYPVVAIRYEDILKDATQALRPVFKYCDIDPHDQAVARAIERDTQRNTPFSRQTIAREPSQVYSPSIARELDVICDEIYVPRLSSPCILPGTITFQPNFSNFCVENETIKCDVFKITPAKKVATL